MLNYEFYALHSFPIFILLTCSIPVVSMNFQSEWNIVDHDQLASMPTDLYLQFSKRDKSGFRGNSQGLNVVTERRTVKP